MSRFFFVLLWATVIVVEVCHARSAGYADLGDGRTFRRGLYESDEEAKSRTSVSIEVKEGSASAVATSVSQAFVLEEKNIVKKIVEAVSRVKAGGNVTTESELTANAIGDALATAITESEVFVNVTGDGFAKAESSGQARATASTTAKAILLGVTEASNGDQLAISQVNVTALSEEIVRAVVDVSLNANSTGGSKKEFKGRIAVAAAQPIAAVISNALATITDGTARVRDQFEVESHRNDVPVSETSIRDEVGDPTVAAAIVKIDDPKDKMSEKIESAVTEAISEAIENADIASSKKNGRADSTDPGKAFAFAFAFAGVGVTVSGEGFASGSGFGEAQEVADITAKAIALALAGVANNDTESVAEVKVTLTGDSLTDASSKQQTEAEASVEPVAKVVANVLSAVENGVARSKTSAIGSGSSGSPANPPETLPLEQDIEHGAADASPDAITVERHSGQSGNNTGDNTAELPPCQPPEEATDEKYNPESELDTEDSGQQQGIPLGEVERTAVGPENGDRTSEDAEQKGEAEQTDSVDSSEGSGDVSGGALTEPETPGEVFDGDSTDSGNEEGSDGSDGESGDPLGLETEIDLEESLEESATSLGEFDEEVENVGSPGVVVIEGPSVGTVSGDETESSEIAPSPATSGDRDGSPADEGEADNESNGGDQEVVSPGDGENKTSTDGDSEGSSFSEKTDTETGGWVIPRPPGTGDGVSNDPNESEGPNSGSEDGDETDSLGPAVQPEPATGDEDTKSSDGGVGSPEESTRPSGWEGSDTEADSWNQDSSPSPSPQEEEVTTDESPGDSGEYESPTDGTWDENGADDWTQESSAPSTGKEEWSADGNSGESTSPAQNERDDGGNENWSQEASSPSTGEDEWSTNGGSPDDDAESLLEEAEVPSSEENGNCCFYAIRSSPFPVCGQHCDPRVCNRGFGIYPSNEACCEKGAAFKDGCKPPPEKCYVEEKHGHVCREDQTKCLQGSNMWGSMEECCRPGNAFDKGCKKLDGTEKKCWLAGTYYPVKTCIQTNGDICNRGWGVWQTEDECCKKGNAFSKGCEDPLPTPCWVKDMHKPVRLCRKEESIAGCYQGWGTYPTEEKCCAKGAAFKDGCSGPDEETQ